MKRKLFFWLEKLKITRAERYAVTFLMALLTFFVLLNKVVHPTSPFDHEYYQEIEEQFIQRTALIQQKEQRVLARYQPSRQPISAATDTIPENQISSAKRTTAMAGSLVNINTADAKALQTLTGIGAAYAARILSYRQENGAFKTKDDLMKIKGIGPARLKKIKRFITLGDYQSNAKSAMPETARQKKYSGDKPEDKPAPATAFVVNVNKADAKSLQRLPGVGPAYARRIIEYRQENGSFTTKDELIKVKGIGKKRLAKIKPFVKLRDLD